MKKIGSSPGIAIGRIFLYKKNKIEIYRKTVKDSRLEIERFINSLEKAKKEIDKLYDIAIKDIGKKEAEIFTAHRMMLEDPEFIGEVKKEIKNKEINAQWAVENTVMRFIKILEGIEDEYLKARTGDLKDISNRILRILENEESTDLLSIEKESIIVSEELTPSDTAAMNKKKVLGFITELGGRTSHTSIIARSLEIPAVVGVEDITKLVKNGDKIIIDGSSGDILLNPTDEELDLYKKRLEKEKTIKKELNNMIGKTTQTKDGHRLTLSGNISTIADIENILNKEGEGVGLFRSEFLYMNKLKAPSEEEQFEVYKNAALRLKNKPLIIRTLDVGGDKALPYLDLPKEMNPFWGIGP